MAQGFAYFSRARQHFHQSILNELIRYRSFESDEVPSFADKHSKLSRELAIRIVEKLAGEVGQGELSAQTSGRVFEDLVLEFIRQGFAQLQHLRPGRWDMMRVSGRDRLLIARFEQYAHLTILDAAARSNLELAAALGSDYTVSPDIVIARLPEPDERLNQSVELVDSESATHTSLRACNGGQPLLHASISCKWTIRSDRSQNARTEALNLIRNRKGRSPHIVVVTAEPLPSRLASIALGTGDIDCVYHFALYELIAAVEEAGLEDAQEMLNILIEGKRLRDISDLPLDLAI